MTARRTARWLVITGFILLLPTAACLSFSRTNPAMRRVGYVFAGAAFASYGAGRILYFGLLYKRRTGKSNEEDGEKGGTG